MSGLVSVEDPLGLAEPYDNRLLGFRNDRETAEEKKQND
jgi:hypothetical protein